MSNARKRRSHLVVTVAVPAAAALALGTFAAAGSAQASDSSTRSIAGTHPVWAAANADRGAAASGSTVTTEIYLAGRDPQGLATYAEQVSDPKSSIYGHYLSTSQYAQRFGATQAQISSVERWLRGAGLRVSLVNEHEIQATGTVAQTEHAYGTQLHEYATSAGTFRAPTSDAQVPAAVSGAVLSVNGLDNRPQLTKPTGLVTPSIPTTSGGSKAKPQQSKGADGAPYLGSTPCSAYYGQAVDTTDPQFNGANAPYAICGYTPKQLRGAYGVTSSGLSGKGVTVAIVDAYGSPTMRSDANEYAVNQGDKPFSKNQYTETVTPSQWTNVDLCGGTAGWAGEESLDVESLHAMAPDAKVHYMGANSCLDNDLIASIQDVVDHHLADVISDSWGEVITAASPSNDEPPANMAEFNQLFEQAAVEGISVTFSAGDCGAEDPATGCGQVDGSGKPQADFPSSSPWVTSVGGTSLAIGSHDNYEWSTDWGTDGYLLDSSSDSWQNIGWIYGTGGGTSDQFAEPWYQKGVVPNKLAVSLPDGTTAKQPMRVTPDVAMDGDPFTGFLFGMTQPLPDGSTGYAESDIGGTSLASPLFAGLTADRIQGQRFPVGFVNPSLYATYRTPLYHDVFSTPNNSGQVATNVLAPYEGSPSAVVTFGDDQILKATPGYDDTSGVGTPSTLYLRVFGR
jgi:subtilase family serine protease